MPFILLHILYFPQLGVRANSSYTICFTVISVFSIPKYLRYRKYKFSDLNNWGEGGAQEEVCVVISWKSHICSLPTQKGVIKWEFPKSPQKAEVVCQILPIREFCLILADEMFSHLEAQKIRPSTAAFTPRLLICLIFLPEQLSNILDVSRNHFAFYLWSHCLPSVFLFSFFFSNLNSVFKKSLMWACSLSLFSGITIIW